MEGFTPAATAIAEARAADPQRAAYIAGLRILAGVLEGHPEIRVPYGTDALLSFPGTPEGVEEMAAARRAFAGTWEKRYTGGGEHTDWFSLHAELGGKGGVKIELYAPRDAVCTRVVKGTEQRPVEKVIRPAETETVMESVEIVEWVCGSALSDVATDDEPAAVAA